MYERLCIVKRSRGHKVMPNGIIEIPLTQGYVALIDQDDLERVSRYRWHISRRRGDIIYAAGRVKGDASGGSIYMHRLIMNAPSSVEVDHRNRNRLDNRRGNLRLCDGSVNRMNSGKPRYKNTTSRYRGVSYQQHRGTWQGSIKFRGQVFRKTFKTEVEAAQFYNAKAIELLGDDCLFLNMIGATLTTLKLTA